MRVFLFQALLFGPLGYRHDTPRALTPSLKTKIHRIVTEYFFSE